MSLNQSMNISVSSMKNYQYALTVVSQNIANLYSEDYVRQTVNFTTNAYTTNCENVLSTIRGMNGASISSLSSSLDNGALNSLVEANSDAGYYNTLSDALSALEDIADDLGDDGLNALLNEFYTACANLEQYPSDASIRQQFVLAAQNVCDKFNDISNQYDSLEEDMCDEATINTTTINSLLSELAAANEAHVKSGQSEQTLAEINSILSELSNYMDITYDTNANGSVNLYLGTTALVEGGVKKYDLVATVDTSGEGENVLQFSLQSTEDDSVIENVNDCFTSGSMKAYLEFLNGTENGYSNLSSVRSTLNTAAAAFAQALNDIQTYDDGDVFAASITTDSETGDLILEKSTVELVVSSDGNAIDASNISINSLVVDNPYLVAAARIDLSNYTDEDGNVDDSWIYAVGNSDNATEFTGLQNAKICAYNSDTNNCTLSQFLTYSATETATDAASLESLADTYQSIADTADSYYTSLIGVNLDEELADMIKYQRAYEASAALFSTINDLYDTIINMV